MKSENGSCEKTGINKALKRFGGFVRYYDTTEPLEELARLVSAKKSRDVLACCAGGDQALTILGAADGINDLWAVDVNPAQLFVLAAKACFLKQKNIMPTFGQLQKAYPGRISALKKNILSLQSAQLYHKVTGKIIAPPAGLSDKYALVTGGDMFVLAESGPFWQKDRLFRDRVRARLGALQFARMDIFDSPEHFKQGCLDLIYLSDIYWPEALVYYQAKLAGMAGLLRPGGRIITYLDQGDDFMGSGISPGRLLAKQARALSLKINTDQTDGYLVLERVGKGR